MIYVNQFFFKIFNPLRKLYLNSGFYNKKISKINSKELIYKPSAHFLSSLINFQKKIKIDDFSTEDMWINKDLNEREFKNLNNFYWLLSLDLKSSKRNIQFIISNWIKNNHKFNSQSWDSNLTAKRIIAWLSCHDLTYGESNQQYKNDFNEVIQKQTNHLINEIDRSNLLDDKLVICASIILVGLCYKNQKNYLSFGTNFLKRISKLLLDNYGFPKSRNIKQLVLYLKYYILIREWFRESHTNVPENIDETVYYLGQGYAFFWQNTHTDLLFNGNNISKNTDFDNYLKRLGYSFKNENKKFSDYIILKDKKVCLAMDVGSVPNSEHTKNYQSGTLSFEIISNGKKLITNCGYYKKKNKLNQISRSTASHSTLTIDDNSSCKFTKINDSWIIKKGLKVIKKSFVCEKNYWKINALHDGYVKKFNSIHEREIEFFPEQMSFVGVDKIIKKKGNHNYKFDIRFHLEPNVKLMKTQDNKTILIELDDEGWKFTCDNYDINIDNGLYFGNKNLYTENQNIFITGVSNNRIENIKWEIKKI